MNTFEFTTYDIPSMNLLLRGERAKRRRFDEKFTSSKGAKSNTFIIKALNSPEKRAEPKIEQEEPINHRQKQAQTPRAKGEQVLN